MKNPHRRDGGGPGRQDNPKAQHNTTAQRHVHYIMGRNCLREVLRRDPERIKKIYAGRHLEQQGGGDEIGRLADRHRIPVEFVAPEKLSALVQSESHQSYVAEVAPRPTLELRDFIDQAEGRERGLLLILDSILDPQNVGTILRAAECFGAEAVIWSRNRGVPLTPAVSKASVGASELVPIVLVSNLVEATERIKKAGYWTVAAALGEEAVNINEFDFPAKAAVIMGAEGEGIQPLLLKQVEYKVIIPMYGQIDSLNVSQATAVFLSRYRAIHSK